MILLSSSLMKEADMVGRDMDVRKKDIAGVGRNRRRKEMLGRGMDGRRKDIEGIGRD